LEGKKGKGKNGTIFRKKRFIEKAKGRGASRKEGGKGVRAQEGKK